MAAAVEDRHRVADAEPQHARQMLRFVPRQRHVLVAGIHGGREEAMHAGDYSEPAGIQNSRVSEFRT